MPCGKIESVIRNVHSFNILSSPSGDSLHSAIFAAQFVTMNFQLSEEHLMIRQAARDFAQNQCLPGVIERDEKMKFPMEQMLQLADLGFLGMMVSPDYGGART
jgi:hypothetical protein